MQKALGRGESMVVEFGCIAAVSEACKVVAEERTGLIREPPYAHGFSVKISGEVGLKMKRARAPSCSRTGGLALHGLAVRIGRIRCTTVTWVLAGIGASTLVPPNNGLDSQQLDNNTVFLALSEIFVAFAMSGFSIVRRCCILCAATWNPCHPGPGSVFIQSTHTARLSRAGRAAAQRASGGADMMKAAMLTLVVMIAVFSLMEWEEV